MQKKLGTKGVSLFVLTHRDRPPYYLSAKTEEELVPWVQALLVEILRETALPLYLASEDDESEGGSSLLEGSEEGVSRERIEIEEDIEGEGESVVGTPRETEREEGGGGEGSGSKRQRRKRGGFAADPGGSKRFRKLQFMRGGKRLKEIGRQMRGEGSFVDKYCSADSIPTRARTYEVHMHDDSHLKPFSYPRQQPSASTVHLRSCLKRERRVPLPKIKSKEIEREEETHKQEEGGEQKTNEKDLEKMGSEVQEGRKSGRQVRKRGMGTRGQVHEFETVSEGQEEEKSRRQEREHGDENDKGSAEKGEEAEDNKQEGGNKKEEEKENEKEGNANRKKWEDGNANATISTPAPKRTSNPMMDSISFFVHCEEVISSIYDEIDEEAEAEELDYGTTYF